MKGLFPILKTRYKKVSHPCLPAIPEAKQEFVFNGKGFKGKPPLLNDYIRGGISFSEKRRAEIKQIFSGKGCGGAIVLEKRNLAFKIFCNKIFKNEV